MLTGDPTPAVCAVGTGTVEDACHAAAGHVFCVLAFYNYSVYQFHVAMLRPSFAKSQDAGAQPRERETSDKGLWPRLNH